MKQRYAIGRWLGALLCLTVLVATASAPVDAKSYDTAKLDPVLLQRALADPAASFDVIVRATEKSANSGSSSRDKINDKADRAGRAVNKAGGKAKFALGIVGGAAGRLNGKDLLGLTRDSDVDYVFADARYTASFDPTVDGAKTHQPGIDLIQANAVWSQLGLTGKGIGVAVVDSGVFAHPDLAGRIVAAVDYTNGTPIFSSTPLSDPGGHGTHVAGLVAGDGTRSNGTYTGSAPGANVVDVRVIDGNGNSDASIILRGLQWVLANRHTYNIRVVNMSFGAQVTGSYRQDPLATAAEVLTFAGLVVVASAGNSGPNGGTITSPAYDPYVITVGALDDNQTLTATDDSLATFSSRGPLVYDRGNKPDLIAPGRRMISALSPNSTIANLYPERQVTAVVGTTTDLLGNTLNVLAPAPEYLRMSGTSMAAPVVSGIAALMLERNPTLGPSQIKNALKQTTTKLTWCSTGCGAGLVNALKAVSMVGPTREYAGNRVTDAFARDMKKFVYGQPLPWTDLLVNGGVDSHNISWENITWDNITWDNITWDNLTWENFTWENITWETVTWESVTWQSAESLSAGALSGTGSGFEGAVE